LLGLNGKAKYIQEVATRLQSQNVEVETTIRAGPVAKELSDLISAKGIDLLVISSHAPTGLKRVLRGSVTDRLLQMAPCPVLVIRPCDGGPVVKPNFGKLLVTLDGSESAECVLPYARAAASLGSEVILLHVPEVPEAELFGAATDEIQKLRAEVTTRAQAYLAGIAAGLEEAGLKTHVLITGSRPGETILTVARHHQVDLIMMATHGRGGMERLFMGEVAVKVMRETRCPVFFVPARQRS